MVQARHTLSHYALIFMDNDGFVRIEDTPSVRNLSGSFFTPELREKFATLVRAKVGVRRTIPIGTLVDISCATELYD
jgi:hypothetical protein